MHRVLLIAVFAILGSSFAASPSAGAELGEATGVVTLDGKPLADGKITLYRDNGQFVGAKIKDGKFAIDFVPAGTLKVTLEGKEVPAKYGLEDASGLTVTVTAGKNVFDFSLSK